ncbi:unnamed protein product, partial [marine sediment metagenome]
MGEINDGGFYMPDDKEQTKESILKTTEEKDIKLINLW